MMDIEQSWFTGRQFAEKSQKQPVSCGNLAGWGWAGRILREFATKVAWIADRARRLLRRNYVGNDVNCTTTGRSDITAQQLGWLGSEIVELAISARHGVLHQPDHDYIEKKLPRLTHLFERLLSVKVTVDFQKSNPRVEVLVSAEHKHDFVAQEAAPHVKEAFDLALAKMESQLRKYKEKIQDHHRRVPEPVVKEENSSVDDTLESEV